MAEDTYDSNGIDGNEYDENLKFRYDLIDAEKTLLFGICLNALGLRFSTNPQIIFCRMMSRYWSPLATFPHQDVALARYNLVFISL